MKRNKNASAVSGDVDDGSIAAARTERLSWTRLAIVVAVIALIAGATAVGIKAASGEDPRPQHSWSVPYVDVTLTPTYEFQNPQSNPARDIALAFIVADPKEPCSPSWGGAYSMDEASRQLELDRRITQLRAAGGDAMVSFGGQANEELAFACTDPDKLTGAYRDVVTRYDVKTVDFDIENSDIADAPSIERRAQAVATVQKERAAAGSKLAVWITLPVATSGFTAAGVALVNATIAGGVDVAGINAMTMNFSSPDNPTRDMLAATKSALTAAVGQIAAIYSSHGIELNESQRWARLGATPMIGQNDVDGEVFTLDDARGLASFATTKGLGRVSTWSLNRDQPCNPSFVDVSILSNNCSSVVQKPLEFAGVFTALVGRPPNRPQTDSVVVVDNKPVVDDPSTSPYPIWRPAAQYVEGYKVVRRGVVYVSKWYNQGADPSAPVANAWDTPWSLVGPVDANDVPFTPSTVAPGSYPQWTPTTFYNTGDKVLLEGLGYEARWPNQAEVPSLLFPVGPDSAWKPMFTLRGEPTTS
ncbi:MAG: chitinase [Ilumatobacteraceae bacterium]